MKQFEYQRKTIYNLRDLNEYGKEGWQIATILPKELRGLGYEYILMREIETDVYDGLSEWGEEEW